MRPDWLPHLKNVPMLIPSEEMVAVLIDEKATSGLVEGIDTVKVVFGKTDGL